MPRDWLVFVLSWSGQGVFQGQGVFLSLALFNLSIWFQDQSVSLADSFTLRGRKKGRGVML